MAEKIEPSDSSGKKKVNVAAIVGLIVGAGLIILVQQLFFKPPSYDETMMRAASELNKSCPMMVDQETRLDNAVSLPGNIFQYNYTLINIEKTAIDIDGLVSHLQPNIINNVKTNPDMKINRENKTTMAYSYKDKHGEFLFKISVTPDKYGN